MQALETTISPVPLHLLHWAPLLARPEPRHFGHFLALITVISNVLEWGEEYNTLGVNGRRAFSETLSPAPALETECLKRRFTSGGTISLFIFRGVGRQ